jgi:hypothetical protein
VINKDLNAISAGKQIGCAVGYTDDKSLGKIQYIVYYRVYTLLEEIIRKKLCEQDIHQFCYGFFFSQDKMTSASYFVALFRYWCILQHVRQ